MPTFTTLTQRVGDAPVYMDWPAAFAYPCVNPLAEILKGTFNWHLDGTYDSVPQ